MAYTIKFVSQMTSINEHTIRAWEKRYQIITPPRNAMGKRIFNDDHIQFLNQLKSLTSSGRSISELAKKERSEIDRLYKAEKEKIQCTIDFSALKNKATPLQKEILKMAVLEKRTDVLFHEMANEERTDIESIAHYLETKILPLWEIIAPLENEEVLRIPRSIIHEKLLSILLSFPSNGSEKKESMLVGSFGDSNDEIHALLNALPASARGHRVIHIGPRHTPESLCELIKAFSPTQGIIALGPKGLKSMSRLEGLQLTKLERPKEIIQSGQTIHFRPYLSKMASDDYCLYPQASGH